jgi:putative ABC transport system permease protein
MIKNLVKTSFRTLKKQKGYVLINIIGLSAGIACSLIIALFIIHELSFDQFNEKKNRIYRLNHYFVGGDREFNFAMSFPAFGPSMRREIPEVEDFNRMHVKMEVTIKYHDKTIIEKNMIVSEPSFFTIFSIPVLKGDKKKLLTAPHTLVLSESTAKKIFGDEDPIDKILMIQEDSVPFRVTGVMADIPETSHFNANMIASFTTYFNTADNDWRNIYYYTYILLKPNAKPETVNTKIQELVRKYIGKDMQKAFGTSFEEFVAKTKDKYYLQSLNDIHFNQSVEAYENVRPSTNPKYLYIFGSIAILILIIAAINFMNLSTTQASKRAKETGIKKVSGSSKGMLISQFLAESVFLSFLSLLLAVIIIENSLPYFNSLLGIKLQMNLFSHWFTIPILLIFSVLVGLLSGSYPAFFLSSFNPNTVLKDGMKSGRLRSILVIVQFSISMILIVGTIVMVRQIRFMLNKDLGFNKEQLLVITGANSIGNEVNPFKEAISRIPGIIKVASSNEVPGHTNSHTGCEVEGEPGKTIHLSSNDVDYDFFDTYGMKLSSGRFFSESFVTDKDACIVNESTIKKLNLNNPFTTRLIVGGKKQVIIGVVKNFHFEPLNNEINPYIFEFKSGNTGSRYISIRMSPKATANTITGIEKVWKKFSPNNPFHYYFTDQDFAQRYKEEKQSAQLSIIFSILAIIIASLGLFGLTSFTIEQRTKEIGIRKAMGDSIAGIFYLISKEFILLVSISTLFAWPLVYYIANKWLQNYYYRINLQPFDFLTGFIIIIIISLLTVGYRTVKAAKTNPVEALRYE